MFASAVRSDLATLRLRSVTRECKRARLKLDPSYSCTVVASSWTPKSQIAVSRSTTVFTTDRSADSAASPSSSVEPRSNGGGKISYSLPLNYRTYNEEMRNEQTNNNKVPPRVGCSLQSLSWVPSSVVEEGGENFHLPSLLHHHFPSETDDDVIEEKRLNYGTPLLTSSDEKRKSEGNY